MFEKMVEIFAALWEIVQWIGAFIAVIFVCLLALVVGSAVSAMVYAVVVT